MQKQLLQPRQRVDLGVSSCEKAKDGHESQGTRELTSGAEKLHPNDEFKTTLMVQDGEQLISQTNEEMA